MKATKAAIAPVKGAKAAIPSHATTASLPNQKQAEARMPPSWLNETDMSAIFSSLLGQGCEERGTLCIAKDMSVYENIATLCANGDGGAKPLFDERALLEKMRSADPLSGGLFANVGAPGEVYPTKSIVMAALDAHMQVCDYNQLVEIGERLVLIATQHTVAAAAILHHSTEHSNRKRKKGKKQTKGTAAVSSELFQVLFPAVGGFIELLPVPPKRLKALKEASVKRASQALPQQLYFLANGLLLLGRAHREVAKGITDPSRREARAELAVTFLKQGVALLSLPSVSSLVDGLTWPDMDTGTTRSQRSIEDLNTAISIACKYRKTDWGVELAQALSNVNEARSAGEVTQIAVACATAANLMHDTRGFCSESVLPAAEELAREAVAAARKARNDAIGHHRSRATMHGADKILLTSLICLHDWCLWKALELGCGRQGRLIWAEAVQAGISALTEALELAERSGDVQNGIIVLKLLSNYFELGVKAWPSQLSYDESIVDWKLAAKYRTQLFKSTLKIRRSDVAEECPICLESLDIRIPTTTSSERVRVQDGCMHVLHQTCYVLHQQQVEALDQLNACPICRTNESNTALSCRFLNATFVIK
jgi:hypothetical protein